MKLSDPKHLNGSVFFMLVKKKEISILLLYWIYYLVVVEEVLEQNVNTNNQTQCQEL